MEGKKYPNSGVLFNADKRKPTAPDFTGRAEITCPHCKTEERWELASWIKVGQKGKFFSLSLKRPREEREQTNDFPWEN